MSTSIGLLRGIGIIEGISYLVLLFIAVPLKYAAWLSRPCADLRHGTRRIVYSFCADAGHCMVPPSLAALQCSWSIHCVAFAVRHVCSRCPLAEKVVSEKEGSQEKILLFSWDTCIKIGS